MTSLKRFVMKTAHTNSRVRYTGIVLSIIFTFNLARPPYSLGTRIRTIATPQQELGYSTLDFLTLPDVWACNLVCLHLPINKHFGFTE